MQECKAVLKSRGLRATSQRVVLLRLLLEVEGHRHLTAQEIHDRATETLPGLNLATVYRTLEGLNEAGLVDRLDAGLDQVRYSYRDPEHRHGHLCCSSCGKVDEFDYRLVVRLAEELKERHGFQLSTHHLGLSGLCKTCQSRNSESK